MMHNEHTPEDRKLKGPTEARQGEISKGAPMRKVLIISIALTVVAFLIIYFVFAS